MKKKFFQKHTLSTVEEVIAIASLHTHITGTESDVLLGSLFTEEEKVGKDNVDLSNCFFVTKDMSDIISTYIDKYPQFKDILEAHPEIDTHSMVETLRVLKKKMLGEDTLTEAIQKDVEVFGDDVAYYDICPIITMFRVLEVLG